LESVMMRAPAVLGRRLAPFSLSHCVILDYLESPFVPEHGTAEPGFADLVLGVWVCSRPGWPDGIEGLYGAGLEHECKRWGRGIREADVGPGMAAFAQYIRDFSQAPERWPAWEGQGGRHVPRAPFAFTMACALMNGGKGCGLPEERVWNMPLCLATAYYATCGDMAGDDGLVSEAERRGMAALGIGAEREE